MTARKPSRRVGTYYFLGLDLGKVQDPAAIAVAEVPKPDIHIRHLERIRLGTSYPEVIERVTAIVETLPGADLIVDATGIGRPVIDQMRATGLDPVAVTITSGRFMSFDGNMWRVPKKALLRPLVAASEAGRLKVAKGLRETEAFQRELQAFQRRITARGYSAFGGVGEHDDLVIAVALICWRVEMSRRLGACNAA